MDNISVLIRCRNEEQWIGHSIQSVMDNFKKQEIVVVDNNLTIRLIDFGGSLIISELSLGHTQKICVFSKLVECIIFTKYGYL